MRTTRSLALVFVFNDKAKCCDTQELIYSTLLNESFTVSFNGRFITSGRQASHIAFLCLFCIMYTLRVTGTGPSGFSDHVSHMALSYAGSGKSSQNNDQETDSVRSRPHLASSNSTIDKFHKYMLHASHVCCTVTWYRCFLQPRQPDTVFYNPDNHAMIKANASNNWYITVTGVQILTRIKYRSIERSFPGYQA